MLHLFDLRLFPTADTEQHIDKPLRLYVYSYDFDTIREAVVVPNHHWGGEGLLGCVFGFVFHLSFTVLSPSDLQSTTPDSDFFIVYRPSQRIVSQARYLPN